MSTVITQDEIKKAQDFGKARKMGIGNPSIYWAHSRFESPRWYYDPQGGFV